MIDYKLFEFATTPRTGTTWLMQAAFEVGLGAGFKADVHNPFSKQKTNKPRITLVRHPCNWLRSFHTTIYPAKLNLPTDGLSNIHATDFDEFIRKYLRYRAGEVGRIFQEYKADVCLRTEDLNQSFPELCLSLGLHERIVSKCRKIPVYNRSRRPLPFWNPSLWDRVVDAELDLIERYEYQMELSEGETYHYYSSET